MFDIAIEDKLCKSDYGGQFYPAEIIINESRESFQLPAGYWTVSEYKKNWLCSLEDGLKNKTHSALAVSMGEAENTNFIFTWVVYFKNNEAKVQNIMMFMDEMPGFTPRKINDFVKDYEEYNEDGLKISEWSIDYKSIDDFVIKLKGDLLL